MKSRTMNAWPRLATELAAEESQKGIARRAYDAPNVIVQLAASARLDVARNEFATTVRKESPMPANTESRQERQTKVSYVGAPKIFLLTQECQKINDAFGHYGCYLVGSALERADWRDVDVRFILPDEEFAGLFPDAAPTSWEFDPRWLLLTTAISEQMSRVTGLPIDFQFQPQTHANEKHKGQRQSLGLRVRKEDPTHA